MLKEIVKKVLICDGCKQEHSDEDMNIVTFTTHRGIRRYDICDKCMMEWEDILKRPVKEPKKGLHVTLADFSIENREKFIAGNQAPSTEKVESLGEDRYGRVRKIMQKMAADGYSATKIAKLSGLAQTNVSRLLRGDSCAPRSSTLDLLEKMFAKEGYAK